MLLSPPTPVTAGIDGDRAPRAGARVISDPDFLRWTNSQWRWGDPSREPSIHVTPIAGTSATPDLFAVVISGNPHHLMLLVNVRNQSFKVVRDSRTLTRSAGRDPVQWEAVEAFLLKHRIIPSV